MNVRFWCHLKLYRPINLHYHANVRKRWTLQDKKLKLYLVTHALCQTCII